jgi:formamidopyrimidine-DNA glycosylase
VPEGHTIHRLARDIAADLGGQHVRVSSPQGRFTDGAAALDGKLLVRTEALGKHLLLWWRGGVAVHVHLGLFGRFRRRATPPPPPGGAVRLRLEGTARTWDLSGPTLCALVRRRDRDALAARLGPDPLRDDADPDAFVARVRASRRAVGGLLLDQTVVAGVGNVYRAEALFVTGIHPARPGSSLSDAEARLVWSTITAQLADGLRLGRIVTVDPHRAGTRSERLWIYKRATCRRCRGSVESFTVAARRTWACPGCQPRAPRPVRAHRERMREDG